MKLENWVEGYSYSEMGESCILLKDATRVLSVTKNQNEVAFMEECDSHFSITYTKEEALKVIQELRDWINS